MQSKAPRVIYLGGIGSGKTYIEAEKVVHLLLQGGHGLAITKTYKGLRLVLMREIEQHLRDIGVKYELNSSLMVLTVPQTGGTIFGFSSEAIETVRGVTVDFAVIDEAALLTDYDYDVIIGRLRRGKLPSQVFMGTTPRGSAKWLRALIEQEGTHVVKQSTMDNPFLPKSFIEELKARYDGDFYRQEVLAEWIDSDGYAQLIPAHLVASAQGRAIYPQDGDLIAGLDVARFGDDSSVICARRGSEVVAWKRWQGLPLDRLGDAVVDWVQEFLIDVLVVDSVGIGAGVHDHLVRQLGQSCEVLEFNGGLRADEPGFSNLRASTWNSVKKWLETGKIPSEKQLIDNLTSVEYFYDGRGLIALESKEAMKRRGEPSPDFGDALAMTMWERAIRRRSHSELADRLISFQADWS